MKTKKVSVEIEEADYKTLEAIAKACDMKIGAVVAQCVKSGMPPSLAKVPESFHQELIDMNGLGDLELLGIVEGSAPKKKLTEAQKKADFDILQKTYALRLLRWRGHSIPLPYENMIG